LSFCSWANVFKKAALESLKKLCTQSYFRKGKWKEERKKRTDMEGENKVGESGGEEQGSKKEKTGTKIEKP